MAGTGRKPWEEVALPKTFTGHALCFAGPEYRAAPRTRLGRTLDTRGQGPAVESFLLESPRSIKRSARGRNELRLRSGGAAASRSRSAPHAHVLLCRCVHVWQCFFMDRRIISFRKNKNNNFRPLLVLRQGPTRQGEVMVAAVRAMCGLYQEAELVESQKAHVRSHLVMCHQM